MSYIYYRCGNLPSRRLGIACALLTFSMAATPPASPRPQQPAEGSAGPAGTVSGHVYRADTGAPLAGAVVILAPVKLDAAAYGTRPAPAVRSGPDGAYRFTHLAAQKYSLQANSTGFILEVYGPFVTLSDGQSVDGIDFRLEKAGVIFGTVSDPANVPIQGAAITATHKTAGGRRPSRHYDEARTDDLGRFRISGLTPGDWTVTVDGTEPEPRAETHEQTLSVAVKPGEETPVGTVTIARPPKSDLAPGAAWQAAPPGTPFAVITGRVHDHENLGPPLAADVVVFRQGERTTDKRGIEITPFSLVGQTRTDDRGNFRVIVPAPGDFYIVAGFPPWSPLAQLGYRLTYYPDAASLESAATLHVEPVPATAPPPVDLTLHSSPTFILSVKVSGPSGADSDRYWVDLSPKNPSPDHYLLVNIFSSFSPQITRPDGTTELRGLTPGSYRIGLRRAVVQKGPKGGQTALSAGPIGSSATIEVVDSDLDVEIPVAPSAPNQ